MILLLFACTKEKYIDQAGYLVPKTCDQDASIPSITIRGAKLHSEAFGHPDSSIIICLHGGPGSDYRYMLNVKDLVNYGFRVVFYDQIGSGLSQRFSYEYYIKKSVNEIFFDELQEVIAHYKTHASQKVYLLGESWGGILGSGYVGQHPNEINGLIVGEPGGLRWEDIKEYLTHSQSLDIWNETINDVTYLDQFISGNKDQHAILDYKVALHASKNEITQEEDAPEWRFGAEINHASLDLGEKYKPDFSIGLNQYSAKVLYLHSQFNKAHDDAWAHRIGSAYKNVEYLKVYGVGHSGYISNLSAWKTQSLPKIISYLQSLK